MELPDLPARLDHHGRERLVELSRFVFVEAELRRKDVEVGLRDGAERAVHDGAHVHRPSFAHEVAFDDVVLG